MMRWPFAYHMLVNEGGGGSVGALVDGYENIRFGERIFGPMCNHQPFLGLLPTVRYTRSLHRGKMPWLCYLWPPFRFLPLMPRLSPLFSPPYLSVYFSFCRFRLLLPPRLPPLPVFSFPFCFLLCLLMFVLLSCCFPFFLSSFHWHTFLLFASLSFSFPAPSLHCS